MMTCVPSERGIVEARGKFKNTIINTIVGVHACRFSMKEYKNIIIKSVVGD